MAKFQTKFILTILLVTFISIAIADDAEDETEEAGDVVILSDEDFDQINSGFRNSLVMFHAPWCGHCKRLSPEYAKAATILKDNDPPVALVKVDCTTEKKTCNEYMIKGYPTVKIFKNGDVVDDYKGPRQSAGIVEHMRKHLAEKPEETEEEKKVEL